MNIETNCRNSSSRGMAMIIVIFVLLIIMPMFLFFVRWMALHRRGTTQSLVQTKDYYAADGAVNFARYAIPNGLTGWITWNIGNVPYNNTLYVGSGTVVAVQITPIGTP